MRHRFLLPVVCAVLAGLSGCSSSGSRVFGEHTEPCAATVLNNDVADDKKMKAGVDCFMGEFEAGRPVVWDVLTVTVEGDPIPMRYDFDGAEVVITRDTSRDSFGSGGVEEQRCESIRRGDRFPEGSGCERSSGDGFRSDSLP